MNNDLEKFIQKNRKEFDNEVPSGKLWERIEKTIPVKKDARRFSMKDVIKWSAAAAVFFAVLTTVYFLYIKKDSHEKQITKDGTVNPGTKYPDELTGITPEYAGQFQSVYKSVATRQQELKAAASEQPELYRQFEEDLKALDSSYKTLREQASQTPNRDVLIKAMIQNLELQAELLNRQLLIIKEIKNTKTESHEKAI